MRKRFTLFLLALMLVGSAQAQTKTWRSTLGLMAGTNQYSGDWANDFYKFGTVNPFGGLQFSQYLSRRADISFSVLSGSWGYEKEGLNSFDVKLLHASAQLKIKLINDDDPCWLPYAFVGVGINNYSSYTIDHLALLTPNAEVEASMLAARKENLEKVHGALPFGVGMQFRLAPRLFLYLQETFVYSGEDSWDNISSGNSDEMLMHTVGLSFGLNEWKDTDHDGVGDKLDKCPGTPSIAKVDEFGCPIDTDQDGIADFEDECPLVPGVITGKGCPDRDGDGFTDDKDACPDVAGLSQLNGCPDKDLDGITDLEDECPNEKGLKEFKGCPDTDGDGIRDKDDACPKEKGLAAFKGCPDRDGDGIQDKEDNCPDVPGVKANKGCPEVKEEVKELFRQALTGIKFETGKDVIKKESFTILDNVVQVMKDNPSYKLKIEGHTDNVGDPAKNLDLSDRRAKAVMKYLADHGVDASKMTAQGFGDKNPLGDNTTKDGRAQNRRVEFTVEF